MLFFLRSHHFSEILLFGNGPRIQTHHLIMALFHSTRCKKNTWVTWNSALGMKTGQTQTLVSHIFGHRTISVEQFLGNYRRARNVWIIKVFARLVGNHLQLDCKFPVNLYNVCRLSMGLESYYFVSLSGGNKTKTKALSLFTHPQVGPKPPRQKEIFLLYLYTTLAICFYVFKNQKRAIKVT